jgi:DMSO/TMAO reductase YedYZ molybdopterin-dependent catalytic subunit
MLLLLYEKKIIKIIADSATMATIGQAARKVAFALSKPLVKLTAGGQVPLSDEEGKRVPPGQFATDNFSTLHHESKSEMPTQWDIDNWKLTVDGNVEKKLSLSMTDLRRLPIVNLNSDFHCVTSWTRLDNKWKGVRVKDVLALAKPKGKFVTQTAFSGHTTSTPIDELLDDDVIIAWEQEGKPLTLEHGAPMRIVLPKKYAYKGVKWLNKLTVTDKEELGFWEVRGYSQTADPWQNDRYS